MSNSLNIAVLGEDPAGRAAAAASFGKKASSDDLGFYHTVFQGKIINIVEPSAYPAKLSGLLETVALCDWALVLADRPSPSLGETIVALSLSGTKTVFVSALDLSAFLKDSPLASSPVFTTLDEAKEFLLSQKVEPVEGSPLVYADHCFEVKGVGTVLLGVVKAGCVRVHDTLTAYPQGLELEVKSIQKNDADVGDSYSSDRVGFAIKGAKAELVPRGTVLSSGPVRVLTELSCRAEISRFYRARLSAGEVVHLSCGLQFVPARVKDGVVESGGQGNVVFEAEKPLAVPEGQAIMLCNLNAKGLRVLGRAVLQK